jgi:hypothetical protein
MQEPFLTSLEVTNSETALFLVDTSKVRYIRPFFAKECSVSEAAKSLELPLANMRYWTEKMVELGLLKQTRIEKRKGSPIKYYRSVADTFSVPLEIIPIASIEELLKLRQELYLQRSRKALAKAALKHEGGWHAYYYLEGNMLIYTLMPRKGDLEDAGIFYFWVPFRLTDEQAKAFRAELRDIQTRYMKLSEQNANDVPQQISILLAVQDS